MFRENMHEQFPYIPYKLPFFLPRQTSTCTGKVPKNLILTNSCLIEYHISIVFVNTARKEYIKQEKCK